MGIFGSIGSAFKRGWEKAKNWGKKTINAIGDSAKTVISAGSSGLGWLGDAAKTGREYLRNIPVIGAIGNKLADVSGLNAAIDTGIGAIDTTKNMLNQLGQGDFKGAYNSGLDAYNNIKNIKAPTMPSVQSVLWPKAGENSVVQDVWDKYKLSDTIPKFKDLPRIGMPTQDQIRQSRIPIGNRGSQYPIGTRPQLRSGFYQTGGGLKK
jgi:hypothetical protein